MSTKQRNTSSPYWKTEVVPWLLMALAAIFVIELGIMILLDYFLIPLPRWVRGLLDSLFLVILSIPLLYSIFRYLRFQYQRQPTNVPLKIRVQLFAVVILSIFVVELGIMIVADFLLELVLPIFSGFSHLLADSLLDSFLLVIFLYPLMHVLIIRPFLEQIDERERVEAALREEEIAVANIRAEAEKAEAIKTLSMTYAHNIFNTISPVQGYAEMIIKKLEPSQPEYVWCQKIQENMRQVAVIIDELRNVEAANVTKLGGVDIYEIKNQKTE